MLLVIFYLFTFLNKKADVFFLLKALNLKLSKFYLDFSLYVRLRYIPYEIANWSISMALYDNQVHSIWYKNGKIVGCEMSLLRKVLNCIQFYYIQ